MDEKKLKARALTKRLTAVKNRHFSKLKAYPNVTGVGVGYKIRKGRLTKTICIRVYVERKVPRNELHHAHVIPERLEGCQTDVVQATSEASQAGPDPKKRHSQLRGGLSIGNLDLGGSGTLGTSVFDNITGEDMILSNWHVLCGRYFDECQKGEKIIQPGQGGGDSGRAEDVVARLHRWGIAAITDYTDAAIARLTGHRFLDEDILGIGTISGVSMPELGLHVMKSGRTTGVTEGVIEDVDASKRMNGLPDPYNPDSTTSKLFSHLIVVRGVGQGGDSGSVWVDGMNRVIGLHIGHGIRWEGSHGTPLAYAVPILKVINELNVSFSSGITSQAFVASTSALLFSSESK